MTRPKSQPLTRKTRLYERLRSSELPHQDCPTRAATTHAQDQQKILAREAHQQKILAHKVRVPKSNRPARMTQDTSSAE